MPKVHVLWSVLTNVLLLVLGIIFVTQKNDLLIGLGGAFLGAAVAGLLTTLKTLDAWAQIYEMLCETRNPGFVSEEAQVASFRSLLHHYHVTQIQGGWVWRYERIDLGSTRVPGALIADVAYSGKDGESRKSVFRAGIIDNRLLATNKEQGAREDADAYIYPWMTEPGSAHAGLEVRVTLDQLSAVVPGILSEKPINGWKTTGTVSDAQTIKLLNQCWTDHMKRAHVVLPAQMTVASLSG